jgi:hypothetical protein
MPAAQEVAGERREVHGCTSQVLNQTDRQENVVHRCRFTRKSNGAKVTRPS